jgi:hypothetical protein
MKKKMFTVHLFSNRDIQRRRVQGLGEARRQAFCAWLLAGAMPKAPKRISKVTPVRAGFTIPFPQRKKPEA